MNKDTKFITEHPVLFTMMLVGWVVLLMALFMMISGFGDKDETRLKGIEGSLDNLYDEVGHIRVKANTLHKTINETDWEEYFNKCYSRPEGYIC